MTARPNSAGDQERGLLERASAAWGPFAKDVALSALAIELDDGETRVVRRTTTLPVRNIKADLPPTVPSVS